VAQGAARSPQTPITMSDVITVERLERALALCAYLVELDGPIVVPLFLRIERELAALRSQ
jgi:hypothetical protein